MTLQEGLIIPVKVGLNPADVDGRWILFREYSNREGVLSGL